MIFRDLLYGEIELPNWIMPFLRIPEFVRLRGVRLSNIDSFQYKDFGSATRYDHALGVTHLAFRIAKLRRFNLTDTVHIALAALLHDVGTPPFAHTLEIIFDDVDHELEVWNTLGIDTNEHKTEFNAYQNELPQFVSRCKSLSKNLGITINPETVAQIIDGNNDLGFLIKGSIDLDNIDNVIRGSYYMGIPTSGALAESIAEWLSSFKSQPSLEENIPNNVQLWLELRDEYYRFFFDSNDEEKGRQALLQFIIRESVHLGFLREQMLKKTDEGLISSIFEFSHKLGSDGKILSDAVRKYRQLEAIPKITEIPIDDEYVLNAFRVKASIKWIERNLRQPGFVPMLFFAKRKFSNQLLPKNSLFGYSKAYLAVFALYEPKRNIGNRTLCISELNEKILFYTSTEPWKNATDSHIKKDLRQSLDSWGNWSFTRTKNDSIHAYPSTFVHAIPAAFIMSLRLSGEIIVDPFCGSGITGIEGAKMGCRVICSDINEIALLISRVRSTYLSVEQKKRLLSIKKFNFDDLPQIDPPELDNLYKWHHPHTVDQLTRILSFIYQIDSDEEIDFLKLCFSDILTSTTGRRGKQHGWFADNTPLPRGEISPPFIDSYTLFINKIEKNIRILDNIYSIFERRGEKPSSSLARVSVLRANASNLTPDTYNLKNRDIGGIITSPPYLGMSDYCLGQRLSYAWLFPTSMERDFSEEIGARRRRFNKQQAIEQYSHGLDKFAKFCEINVRPGGFVALVIGASETSKFKDFDAIKFIDSLFIKYGFTLLWEKWRPISWHRNHGYEHLKKEKLIVFSKE